MGVGQRIADGTLQLNGFWFNIARGEMYAYQRDRRLFETIGRNSAERLLSRLDPPTISKASGDHQR